jgi:FixJ family two-component response regulator
MPKQRVIIVDDEPIILSGLENWLSRDYEVKSFTSAKAFLEAYQQPQFEITPTCILLDYQMPETNGVELQNILKEMNSQYPIIFMSGNALQGDIINAWRGGAVDFILKPFTPTQISESIEKQFSLLKYKRNNQSSTIDAVHPPITKREAQVLILLGQGKKQTEVANTLGISTRTVKMYRSFLGQKLGLHSMAEIGKFLSENEKAVSAIANKRV